MKTSLLMLTGIVATAAPAAALTPDEVNKIIAAVDERQRSPGDFKALAYIAQKQKDQNDLIFESVVYRRDEAEKFLLFVLKPKADAGRGWLRVDKNMFLYDPKVGKWERRTERERLANSDTRRADLDASHLARDFATTFKGAEKLGKVDAYKFELVAKKGIEVAYPRLEIWTDVGTGNLMKQLDYGESGKLMRSVYYPKWGKAFSDAKKAEVFYPREIRIFDEVEQGNSTVVTMDKVELQALDANIFTKAWIESKSR